MLPTFKDGRKLLVTKAYWLVGPLQREDIVVVKDNNPAGFMIKRIYRMGGEIVEPKYAPLSHPLQDGPFRVPEGTIYVLGDNRGHSDDSRKIGPIPLGKVLGKVLVAPL
jgi:signal peptidase I